MRILFALLLSFLACTPPVLASELKAESPSWVGQWRIVGKTDAETTSRCYMKPTEPVCALDAYWLCNLRARKEVCNVIEQSHQSSSFYHTAIAMANAGAVAFTGFDFRVLSIHAAADYKMSSKDEEPIFDIAKPNDFIIFAEYGECSVSAPSPDTRCYEEPMPQKIFVLRQVDGLWRIAAIDHRRER